MMKATYKERVKSGVNPLIPLIIWFVGIYLFNIIWGICGILFEFNLAIVKHICALGITIAFGWFFVSKILTEYEFEISDKKFTVKRILSKREKLVAMIAADNIKLVTDNEAKFKSVPTDKTKNFIRPKQDGKTIYIVYKNNDKTDAVKFKTTIGTKNQIENYFKS